VTPDSILGELVRYDQTPPDQVRSFSHLKLDDDLLPTFHHKAERVFEAFEKYRSITYEVRQSRKGGVGLIIAGYSNTTLSRDHERYVAIGLTPFDEFEKDDDLVSKIKQQVDEVKKDYGTQLDHHYLLLCTDDQKHEDRIRILRRKLREDRTVVVEPSHAWAFYTTEDTTVDAVSDRMIYENDHVRRQALEEIADLDKRQLILLLSCLVQAIEEMKDFSVADEFVIHNDHLHDFEASHPGNYSPLEDVSAMEDRFFFRDADVEGFRIYKDSVSAIIALYYDAKVRYGHEGDSAVRYLLAFLERTI